MENDLQKYIEPYVTTKQASVQLGVHYWLLLRLVKTSDIPTYNFGNSKKWLRISEIIAVVEARRKAGA